MLDTAVIGVFLKDKAQSYIAHTKISCRAQKQFPDTQLCSYLYGTDLWLVAILGGVHKLMLQTFLISSSSTTKSQTAKSLIFYQFIPVEIFFPVEICLTLK